MLRCMYTGRDTGPDPVTAGPLRREQAYAELKHRLLQGEFGLNRRLAEERLAAAIGVSRTPIREALTRLHAEGLVAKAPDGGYLPTVPDAAAIRHCYEVRIGLELQALHRPARVGGSHDLATIEALHAEWLAIGDDRTDGDGDDDGADPSFVLLDEDFHVRLAEAAGNPLLAELLQQVNERIRLVRMQDFLEPARVPATVEEHLHILEAVLAGRIVEAEAAFTAHVDRSLAVVEERVARVVARMATGGAR